VVRAGNEDAYLLSPESGVFVVADGMGGHAAGEVASSMAVQVTGGALQEVRGRSDNEVADLIRQAIRDANGQIFQRTLSEADKRGMGTTATALVLNGTRYLIGQVGDSRAYVLRDGELAQITKDHSYVQEQVDAGYLTPEQARTHPYSNVITRCVGANSEVVPDVYMGALRTGDTFLLASDGLTGMLEDPDLLSILRTARPPAELVDLLIADANRRGGLDNITVILVRIDSVGAQSDGRQTAAVAQA
jgi:protein phosphatase